MKYKNYLEYVKGVEMEECFGYLCNENSYFELKGNF